MNALVVDGGGTKTKAWLMEAGNRTSLSTWELGPSNFGQVRADGLAAILRELSARLPADKPPRHVVLGLAGVGREPERVKATAVAQAAFPAAEVHMITDAELAYRGAFLGIKNGILLIAGTGTIAYYRTQVGKEFSRSGGWGPLLGDEGGGAWLGREALRHCLWEFERDELSPFHALVLDALGIDTAAQIVTKVYQEGFGPSEWAKLAPIVFQCVREDLGALSILKRAAIELVALAERLQEHLLPETTTASVVVMGGIWQSRHHLQPLMEEEIRVRNLPFVIADPVAGPAEGGVMLLEELGRL